MEEKKEGEHGDVLDSVNVHGKGHKCAAWDTWGCLSEQQQCSSDSARQGGRGKVLWRPHGCSLSRGG